MSTAFKPQENEDKFPFEKQEENFDNFDNDNNQIYENGTKNIQQDSSNINFEQDNKEQGVEFQENQQQQFNDSIDQEFKQENNLLLQQENDTQQMQFEQQQQSQQQSHQFISNKLKRSQSVSSQIFEGLNIYIQIPEEQKQRKDELISKIQALGGNSMLEYSQDCNILIWIDGTAYKFSKVQNTNILTENWIHDCYDQNQKLSFNNYRFQPPKEFILEGQNSDQENNLKRKNEKQYSEDQIQKRMKRENSPSMSAYLGPTNSRVQKDQISEFSLEGNNNQGSMGAIKNMDQQSFNDNDIYNNQDQNNPSLAQIQQGDLVSSQSHTNLNGSNNNNQGRWTTEEHNRFVEALRIYGKNWKKVEEHVGSRSGAQIRSHAQKFFIKQEREYKKQNTSTSIGMNNSQTNMEMSNFQTNSPKIESNGGNQDLQSVQTPNKKPVESPSEENNQSNEQQQQKKKEPKSASKPNQFQNKQQIQNSNNNTNQNLNIYQSKEENEVQRSNKSLQHIKGINEAISKNQQQQLNEQQRNKVINNDQFKMPNQQHQARLLQGNQMQQIGGIQRQENNANLKDEDNILQIEPTHFQETDEVFDDSDYNQYLQGLLNTYNQWNSRHHNYQQLDDDGYTPLELLQNAPPNYPRQDEQFADFQSSSIIHEIQKEQDIPETQNFSKPHRHSVDLDQNEIQMIINDQSKSANSQFLNNIKNNGDNTSTNKKNNSDIQSQTNKLKMQTQILAQDIFPGSKFKSQ